MYDIGKFNEPRLVRIKVIKDYWDEIKSNIESCAVLGEPGAEKLIGNGDMLFYSRSRNKTDRLQGAVVSDDEIIRVIDYFKNASVEKS